MNFISRADVQRDDLSYEDLVKLRVVSVSSSHLYLLLKLTSSPDDIITCLLCCLCCVQDQLMVNCRGYTQETALSQRVKQWEDKIRPELVLQVNMELCHFLFML